MKTKEIIEFLENYAGQLMYMAQFIEKTDQPPEIIFNNIIAFKTSFDNKFIELIIKELKEKENKK